MEELNLGPPKTNPYSGREKDLNPGPLDYKSSALSQGHARILKVYHLLFQIKGHNSLAMHISILERLFSFLSFLGALLWSLTTPEYYLVLGRQVVFSLCLSPFNLGPAVLNSKPLKFVRPARLV